AEEIAAKVADLRQGIEAEIPRRLGKAVAGTPLAGVLGNVNASSRCGQSFETLAVWMNNEVWPPAYAQPAIIPNLGGFVYQIPAATLVRLIDGAFVEVTKTVKDIKIDGHSVTLQAPDSLRIDVDAKWAGLGFQATLIAKLSVSASGQPQCTTEVSATRPQGLFAILNVFLPINLLPSELTIVDTIEGEQLTKLAAKASSICRIADAALTSLFLPRKDKQVEPLQLLTLTYDSLQVDPVLGIVGMGGKPILRAPMPATTLGFVPIGDQAAGRSNYDAAFFAKTTEMNVDGLRYTWTSSNPSRALQLDGYLGWHGTDASFAYFTFAVPPDPMSHVYDLGTMHVV